ncbi:MAG: hypothetical protein V3W34_14845 [Phycisphaerae bacterium]
MRERALHEFEAVFERASIPVLDIQEIALARISVVLTGSPLDPSMVKLASHLKDRFKAEVQVHWSAGGDRALEDARGSGMQPVDAPFNSTAELVGQIGIGRSRLVLHPDPADEADRTVGVDHLVVGTQPPILLIRQPIDDPGPVFQNVLHSLTGNFQQTANFAYSFTLVAESGSLILLHTIDAGDLLDVREALQVAPGIEADEERELLDRMTHHGERYLKGVAQAARDKPYEVRYRLSVGDVITTVRNALAQESYGLLVVGRHTDGHSRIDAADYQLMHMVRDIPVLAL